MSTLSIAERVAAGVAWLDAIYAKVREDAALSDPREIAARMAEMVPPRKRLEVLAEALVPYVQKNMGKSKSWDKTQKRPSWPVKVADGKQSWLIARSCVKCGVLQMAADFGMSQGKYHIICKACRWARFEDRRRSGAGRDQKRRSDADYQRRNRAKRQEQARVRQDRTLATGRRSAERAQWTGPELEIVATRDDLSLEEMAKMLGRTYSAVANKRHAVKRGLGMDAVVAGIPQSAAGETP